MKICTKCQKRKKIIKVIVAPNIQVTLGLAPPVTYLCGGCAAK